MIDKVFFDENNSFVAMPHFKEENYEFSIDPVFFDTEEFHKYHSKFVEKVYKFYPIFNNKVVGFCYLGLNNNKLRFAYSSPFSMFYLRKKYSITDAVMFINALKRFARVIDVDNIQISLPPEIYFNTEISIFEAALFSEGFCVERIDINNYFKLKEFNNIDYYISHITNKVRKNYHNALKNGLSFNEIGTDQIDLVHEIISINRKQNGKPINISINQMKDLIAMESLKCRCFIVSKDIKIYASAIVFDISDKISQVIYWGDDVNYRNERPMDLLTTKIFEYYNMLGKEILDIGTSSENGIINCGLANFKKSIGCDSNVKILYEWNL